MTATLRPQARPWAVALVLVLAVRYVAWRMSDTLNLATPLAAAISLTALVAELLLLAGGSLNLVFSLWLPRRRAPDAPPMAATPFAPAVDVLVPSYGEPLPLVEACLRACLDLDHGGVTVWLLDDSGRDELAQLCRRLGVRYLARPQRLHAKAGNLNHALPHLQGELIAVFDADVLPLRSFLRRTVPWFADPALGFVQTPQTYRNADPVMRNLGLERWLMPDEESFYRWVEPCRAAVGAVVCAGTSFVMRREALLRVGGFETGTASEDLATGIRLTAAGHTNRYLPEKLSAGLAPFTAAALVRQRCRWASGTVQLLRTGAHPLTIPGLSPLQRVAYLEGVLHWCLVLPQLLLALMPLSLGVLGVAPVLVTAEGLLQVALPFQLAQLLLIRWLTAHARTGLLPELYRWFSLLPLAWAVLAALAGRPRPFRVTPKALANGRCITPEPQLLLPLLLLLSLQGVGLVNLLRPAMGQALSTLSPTTLALNLVWACLNLLLLGLVLRACCDRPGLSPQSWLALSLPCSLQGGAGPVPAQLEAISEAGVELRLAIPPPPLSPGEPLALHLPALGPDPLPIVVQARRGRRLGALWTWADDDGPQLLRRFLHGRDGAWPDRRAPSEPLALAVVLIRLLRPPGPEDWFRRSLIPQTPGPARDSSSESA